MCYLLEIGVPIGCEAIVDAVASRAIHVSRDDKTELQKHIPAKFSVALLTSNGCSCDLYKGPKLEGNDPAKDLEKFKAKRRGWSEAKLERALRDRKEQSAGVEMKFSADAKLLLDTVAKKVEVLYILPRWSGDGVGQTKNSSKEAFFDTDATFKPNEIVRVS